jgi:hypothetical protein
VKKSVSIISARTAYEDLYPGDAARWKLETFLDISIQMEKHVLFESPVLKARVSSGKQIITNLIVLGDSVNEIEAGYTLGKQFSHALIKTIKFRENPKPEELIKQQVLVDEKLDDIYAMIKNLTIRLELKK